MYSNSSKNQPPLFQGLFVRNSTIVVSQDEIQALTYWYVALKSPSTFSGSPSVSPMGLQMQGVQTMSLQSPPTPTSFTVDLMSGPGLRYNNVLITSTPPRGLTISLNQYLCNAPNGTKLDPSVGHTLSHSAVSHVFSSYD